MADLSSAIPNSRVDVIGEIANRKRPFPLVAAIIGAIGLVGLLSAIFVTRKMDTVPRSFLAAGAALALYYGIQKLGVYRYGNGFSLGFYLAVLYLAVIAFVSIFADWLPIESIKTTGKLRQRPRLAFPQPLGRDKNGVSFLSQVIFAGRSSLTVVLTAVLIGLIVGSLLGLVAGYFGGWVETIINVLVNSTLAFPPLVLLLVIAAVWTRSVWSISLGLAVVSVPTYARLMRAQTISLREREFVTAARSMGATDWRIMIRDIVPNAALPVFSYVFISAAVLIIAEGSLSYLGLSVPFPKVTWGALVADGKDKLRTDPHLVFVPATVMFLTVLSLNRVGDWARKRALGERNLMS